MIKASVLVESLAGLGAEIEAATREAAREVARELPRRICDHIRRGEAPDGSPFPANASSTQRAKARAGQGSTPGVATGELSDERAWRVEETADEIEVRPPASREDVVDYLDALGYEVLGLPEETARELDAAIARHLERLR